MRGKHRKPNKVARAATQAGTTGAAAALAAIAAACPASAAAGHPSPVLRPPAARHVTRLLAWRSYTVRPGDYLTAIAAAQCGNNADWTGIYAASRAVIGADPNLIEPGQVLTLDCAWTLSAARTATAAPASRTWHRDRFDGHHGDCGDGDGDGYDAPCSVIFPARQQPRHQAAVTSVPVTPDAYHGGSYYSYAALERLWVSAGGPSWAAAHAAEIAECESGGNVYARNPSSAAAGLWQILGSVVPGDLYSPYVNALNAVAKFRASGDTFAQWVCQ